MVTSRFGKEYDQWIEILARAPQWEAYYMDKNYYHRLRHMIEAVRLACDGLERHLDREDHSQPPSQGFGL